MTKFAHSPPRDNGHPIKRGQLSLFDCIGIIMGIVLGTGIFETPSTVAAGASSSFGVLLLWALGGILSLAGALSYAELASRYPENGGDYVYLKEAYGPLLAFTFAWSAIILIFPSTIALVAFPFGRYLQQAFNPFLGTAWEEHSTVIFASSAVVICTALNCAGIQVGRLFQNALSTGKIVALVALCSLALFADLPAGFAEEAAMPWSLGAFNVAMILILFTYGGWSEIAMVASEVSDPHRNLARSLIGGVFLITAIYIGINGSLLYILGHHGVVASRAVFVDALGTVLGSDATRVIALLISLFTLGAVQGIIFTGARMSHRAGLEYRVFGWLGYWNWRLDTPINGLLLQGALALVVIFTTETFDKALMYVTPAVWFFYLLTGVSLFILRRPKSVTTPSFRVPWYPWPPVLFAATAGYILYGAIIYDTLGSLITGGLCGVAFPLYYLARRLEKGADASKASESDVRDAPHES